jgi:hypothetical protein
MNIGFIIGLIIALLIAGFVLWAGRALVSAVQMDPVIRGIIDVLLLIAAVAIVLFYVVIPVLELLAGIHIPLPGGR